MFESLILTDFQKHIELTIAFDPKITTITGPSDAGKSSVLRALRWVCCNVPQGNGFIRQGAKQTCATLMVDGQSRIVRIRGDENEYHLNEKTFRAFGTTVPDDITKLLNVGPINFQGQFDSVFWFSCSAGEVSRQLNSVVDLGVIDDALSNISGVVRASQQIIQSTKIRLEKSKTEFDKLKWVVDADREYREIERTESELNATQARRAALSELVQRTNAAKNLRVVASQAATDCREVGLLGRDCRNVETKLGVLRGILKTCHEYEAMRQKGVIDINDLSEAREKYLAHADRKRLLLSATDAITKATSIVSDARRSLALIDKELEKEFSGVCPTCGRVL